MGWGTKGWYLFLCYEVCIFRAKGWGCLVVWCYCFIRFIIVELAFAIFVKQV